MKKLFLSLLISILCISVFTACNPSGGGSSSGSSSSESSDDGWERVDPIAPGGDYEFNN